MSKRNDHVALDGLQRVASLLPAVFAVGYAHGPAASHTAWAAFPAFLVSMQLVPAAADAVSFLLMWELMALTSTVLVLTEHRGREEVRSAALWYAAMTHLSFVLLLLGFTVLATTSASGALLPETPQELVAMLEVD